MMTRDECEAALCIWEYALSPVDQGRNDEKFLDWLKQGEGWAQARTTVMDITSLCEIAYVWAKHHGYDDCFDWQFVPAWCQFAMRRILPSDLNETWAIQTGFRIYKEWRASILLREET